MRIAFLKASWVSSFPLARLPSFSSMNRLLIRVTEAWVATGSFAKVAADKVASLVRSSFSLAVLVVIISSIRRPRSWGRRRVITGVRYSERMTGLMPPISASLINFCIPTFHTADNSSLVEAVFGVNVFWVPSASVIVTGVSLFRKDVKAPSAVPAACIAAPIALP